MTKPESATTSGPIGRYARRGLVHRAGPQSYAEWKARAAEITGGRAGTMREVEWKRALIIGLDPERAAALVETYKRNNAAADRKRKR